MLQFAVTNIANKGREIILFHRIGKTLHTFHDKSFFPYFYQISPKGVLNTIDNKKVVKIICNRPSDIKNRRDDNSYEADILFTKRYIIDKIASFNKVDLKYSFMDIEVLTKELPSYLDPKYPISCISYSNSYTEEIKTFYLEEMLCEQQEDAEKKLLNNFVKQLKDEQFDLILGWNFIDFDWLYLQARYKHLFGCELSEMLSPIFQAKYLSNSKKEMTPNLIPAGISVMDYLEMFKKIYRNEPTYSLDAIAQKYLNETSYKKVDFSRLSDDIKEKNINDVKRTVELDKKLKIIDYYDELRRMSMCEWSDVTWNSKLLDSILLREAKQKNIILPSKKFGQDISEIEETFEGAYRDCLTGVYKNVYKLDLGSAYPQAIINFCLDIANIRENEGITINNINFYQNSNALLPTIARKLINKKDILKQQLKSTNPGTEEYKDLQTKYDAIKAVVNSLFGVCGLKIFRLFDYRVASTITFLIRDLLHYIENKLKEQGIKVIYLDTDSCFVETNENPKDLMNNLVKQWAKEKYNKDNVEIEFDLEGVFDKIFIIALCHYKGYLRTESGLKEEIKGIEAKRKDSSIFMQKFQNELIEKILNEEPREAIEKFIDSKKEAIKVASLTDIGFPCRLTKLKETYKSIPIHFRALDYTNEVINFEKRLGDSFYYIYIKSFGTSIRKSSRHKINKETKKKELQFSEREVDKDVLAFDEENIKHIQNIDWERMINKTIDKKVEHVFEAMNWNK